MDLQKILNIFEEHGFNENNCSFFRQEDITDIAKDIKESINITPCCATFFFNKKGWKTLQKTCKHKNKYNKWTDYQDRYYKDYCPDCKLTIYEGMD